YVYGMHNNLPEGPAYPIRTITDGEYRYIRNLTPGELYIEKHLMGTRGTGALNNPYWGTWTWDTQQTPASYLLVKRYMLRPAEQLYHTATDPYEMKNLAGDTSQSERRQRFADALKRWMTSQGDPGVEQDTQTSLQSARRGQHRYYPGK
ncbi:MAG: heparan N-sulfatase, partial [Fuerstiella sp.]|nr:heparan N-sulfatase [Fuerstiella sp.]